MSELSRTQKSLRNAKVALIFSVLTFVLGFFSRKILLNALGTDILGLYTTANNLCGFLNLAELGITSAVAFSLYKPIFNNDRHAITEIVSIQGWLFRHVGIAMTVGAMVLMSLFPIFFNEEKTNLPLWYSYATFGVIFLSQVLSYFFCYQQTLLSADQQEFKVVIALQGGRSLKILLQILGIGILGLGYKYWLIAELICGILSLCGIWWTIRRQYPWLNADIASGKTLIARYPIIISKTKQMMVHKICFSIIDRVTPVIVYGMISLYAVAIYGNYMMVITNIGIFIKSCFNSINASIGNLVAEGDNSKVKKYFEETITLRYWLVSIFCYCLYHLASPFMTLWMGEEYVFDNITLICIIAYTFIELTCNTDPFIYAYGLFHDIWAPVLKVFLNIGMSILLGYYFGIAGIISGATISLIIIYHIWKPYFLYHSKFDSGYHDYFYTTSSPMLLIVLSWIISDYMTLDTTPNSILSFVLTSLLILSKYSIVSGILFIVLSKRMRAIVSTLMRYVSFRKRI